MTAPNVHHEDDRRARELFHYFQPENPALLPSCSLPGPSPDTSFSAKKSPNLVLTALTQLAAVKTGTQRAIISLIDRETLYVVAEASRTLNLGDNDVYTDEGDGLWMGCSHGPVAGTLCEKTITLTPTVEDRYPLFVVEDLREHTTYRNIPCVSGPPYFRYYAGTPLTTSNGINIGSLYVIDPRPNLCLPASHKEYLGHIGCAVMEYLETSRQSLEGSRLAKVLSGLNSFVQGEDESTSASNPVYKEDLLSDRASSHPNSSRHTPDSEPANTPPPDAINSDPDELSGSDRDDQINIAAATTATAAVAQQEQRPFDQQTSAWPTDKAGNQKCPTFQRAANIMRESLDLGPDGGVVIFDSSERLELEYQETSDQEKEKQLARLCAISSKERPVGDLGEMSSTLPSLVQLDIPFMHRMLRRYPRGGLWYFHHDGTAFSSDDDAARSSSENDSTSSPHGSQQMLHPRSLGTLREKDLQTLKKNFPNASRIIFAPLWDSFNSQWFGGCFCWSSVETRVFSAHVELGGVLGFGSSLMVEHSRAQSQESDRKKGDFISSISHELRSPLHGILAATGFLYDQNDPEFAKTMLDTIRSCGQTLLDTFEQILDFTKINSFERKRNSTLRSRGERNHEKSRPRSLHIIKVADVAAVVEEVIESVYSGQIFSRSMTSGEGSFDTPGDSATLATGHDERVAVFIDIVPHDWKFLLEPGALRRIIMNVFGNALKYTEEGSVSVRVDLQKKANRVYFDAHESEILVLTVSDTGRGISNDYLRSNVFTPFSQEDPLSPGTGLGLSLVRSILRSLKGGIKIKSELGVGTVVTITLPLKRFQPAENTGISPPSTEPVLPEIPDVVQKVTTQFRGRTVSLVSTTSALSKKPSSLHTIGSYLTEWFGMTEQTWSSDRFFDLIVVYERQLDLVADVPGQPVVLVLCHRGLKSRSVRVLSNESDKKMIWIPLPCGPYRLARILSDYLDGVYNQQMTSFKPPYGAPPLEVTPKRQTAFSTDSVYTKTSTVLMPFDDSDNSVVPLKTELHQLNLSPIPELHDDGLRILLVEDNAINLALLRKFMARLKPQILHTAMNGKIAVDKVNSMAQGYHYIFMDMSMPVMDGFEATHAIRSIEREKPVVLPARIIALTGLGASEHIKRAYAAGVNVFLTKPVSFKDIELILKEAK